MNSILTEHELKTIVSSSKDTLTALHEVEAAVIKKLAAGVSVEPVRCCFHDSDCAVHNMPASPAGPCDCSQAHAFYSVTGKYECQAFADFAGAEAYCKGLNTTHPEGGYVVGRLYTSPPDHTTEIEHLQLDLQTEVACVAAKDAEIDRLTKQCKDFAAAEYKTRIEAQTTFDHYREAMRLALDVLKDKRIYNIESYEAWVVRRDAAITALEGANGL